jgi:hypothetical protein
MAELVSMAEGPKTLTVKLTADHHLKFLNMARQLNISPNQLAQDVIDYFMLDCEKAESEREFPPIGKSA